MFTKIFSFILSIVALISGATVAKSDGIIRYRNIPYGIRAQRQILDLDIPEGLQGEANIVLYVHGGAWTSGSKDDYGASLDDYAARGIVCAAINYRYCGKPNYASVEDVLDDIAHALTKIYDLAAKNGVHLKGVMLDGGSAGAHLSLMYAYTRMDDAPIKPVAVVARSPIPDLTDPTTYDGSLHELNPEMWSIPRGQWSRFLTCMTGERIKEGDIEQHQAALAAISPITYVHENTVPTIIAHGTMDTVLPYSGSVALDAKLTEYGVPHTFITFPGAWHGLMDCPEGAVALGEAVEGYLQQYVLNTEVGND